MTTEGAASSQPLLLLRAKHKPAALRTNAKPFQKWVAAASGACRWFAHSPSAKPSALPLPPVWVACIGPITRKWDEPNSFGGAHSMAFAHGISNGQAHSNEPVGWVLDPRGRSSEAFPNAWVENPSYLLPPCLVGGTEQSDGHMICETRRVAAAGAVSPLNLSKTSRLAGQSRTEPDAKLRRALISGVGARRCRPGRCRAAAERQAPECKRDRCYRYRCESQGPNRSGGCTRWR